MEKIVQTAGRNALGEFAPDFAHFNDDMLFGENWNNQDIDHKTRCIITIVALMSSGVTDFFLEIPFGERKESWSNKKGNRGDYNSCCFLCRLAKGMGGV